MLNSKETIYEKYRINSSTMVIQPIQYGSKIYSKIYEYTKVYISPYKPMDIIKYNCEFFGSTYEGARKAAKKIIRASHKIPISISPYIYFFPTASPDNPECTWISIDYLLYFREGGKNRTIVTLKNDQIIELPISAISLQNQIVRTVLLRANLSKRHDEIRRKKSSIRRYRLIKSSEHPGTYGFDVFDFDNDKGFNKDPF